ncbi:hypothetical protein DTO169E5_8013 [Paecilomyces variotii]|nr:hypothetical protein DTO169C6_7276 [Paecilomyces variotii]KAJ9231401.1 hypothetical protein DTO169E5_8013 [Paecilomyces variotii]
MICRDILEIVYGWGICRRDLLQAFFTFPGTGRSWKKTQPWTIQLPFSTPASRTQNPSGQQHHLALSTGHLDWRLDSRARDR